MMQEEIPEFSPKRRRIGPNEQIDLRPPGHVWHGDYAIHDSGCWMWFWHLSHGKPWWTSLAKVTGSEYVRDFVLFKAGRDLPSDGEFANSSCGQERCILLEHIVIQDIPERKRVARYGGQKITWNDAEEIRARYKNNENLYDLADEKGISYPHAWNIVKYRHWPKP